MESDKIVILLKMEEMEEYDCPWESWPLKSGFLFADGNEDDEEKKEEKKEEEEKTTDIKSNHLTTLTWQVGNEQTNKQTNQTKPNQTNTSNTSPKSK